MTDKKKDLLRNVVSKSIHVSQQTFGVTASKEEAPSDQYIVDGPALRELLKAYRWNYKTMKKHKDWVSTFHWNGPEESQKLEQYLVEQQKKDQVFPWRLVLILVPILALVLTLFFYG